MAGPSAMIVARMRAVIPIVVAVLAAFAAPAQAQSGVESYRYTACASAGEASIVAVVGAACAEAEAVAAQVVAQPAGSEGDVLTAANWRPLRARSTRDASAHDVVATRPGGAALRIRRPGPAPDLDGWSAGRELIFARRRLVGGKPVPRGAVLCTSAFLVRMEGRLGGLSAAHCGGLRSDRTVHRRNVGIRRPPQPGIILGRVRRILTRTRPLDALVVPVPSGARRPRLPVVDRGLARPPWVVAGIGQPTAGREVCFNGRTSGIDQCGKIQEERAAGAERLLSIFAGVLVRCTTIRAREGDSGGPVYTAPRADGTVYAVGIVTLVVGDTAAMCFTPLSPVLSGLNARLVVAAA